MQTSRRKSCEGRAVQTPQQVKQHYTLVSAPTNINIEPEYEEKVGEGGNEKK
jgi:hypothetical protein